MDERCLKRGTGVDELLEPMLRLVVGVGIALAKQRAHSLGEELDLTIRTPFERREVARLDAVLGEGRGETCDQQGVIVVRTDTTDQIRRDEAELLKSFDQPWRGANRAAELARRERNARRRPVPPASAGRDPARRLSAGGSGSSGAGIVPVAAGAPVAGAAPVGGAATGFGAVRARRWPEGGGVVSGSASSSCVRDAGRGRRSPGWAERTLPGVPGPVGGASRAPGVTGPPRRAARASARGRTRCRTKRPRSDRRCPVRADP